MTDNKQLSRLERIINELRALESDFPTSYAAALIYVARHERTNGTWPNVREIYEATGIAKSSMTRVVQAMSDRRLGKSRVGEERPAGSRQAFGLVELEPDAHDMRVKRVKLAAKGRALLRRMADHMGD